MRSSHMRPPGADEGPRAGPVEHDHVAVQLLEHDAELPQAQQRLER